MTPELMTNPALPEDDTLHALFGAADGDFWTIKGLRAVWRAGCDAGMVAGAEAVMAAKYDGATRAPLSQAVLDRLATKHADRA